MKQLIISKKDLLHNLNKIRERVGEARIIAVLKGNGYGLGMVPLARFLSEQGIDFFAVFDLEDALRLRNEGIDGEILLLSPVVERADILRAIEAGITMCVSSFAVLDALDEVCVEMGVEAHAHLKIDTGLGRFGFVPIEVNGLISRFKNKNNTNVKFTGIYTHFSLAVKKNRKDILGRLELFNRCVKRFEEAGIGFEMRHVAETCGTILFPEARLDAVRIGSAFMGLIPIKGHGYRRVARLQSDVVDVKDIPKGSRIGYDNFKIKKDTRIAIIPCGYYDVRGLTKSTDVGGVRNVLRHLYFSVRRHRQFVEIGGEKVPVIGHVGMTNIVADVTGKSVGVGDVVTIGCNPLFVDSTIERIFE